MRETELLDTSQPGDCCYHTASSCRLRGRRHAGYLDGAKRYPLPAIEPAPIKPTISVEDLEKLDVRVGTICEVQEIAESEKLVRLRADFGDHHRTIFRHRWSSVPGGRAPAARVRAR